MVLARARILGVALPFALALVACNNSGTKSGDPPALDLGTQALIGLEFAQLRGCPTCHQSANAGDGILSGQTASPGAPVLAANLTPDVMTGLGGWADIEIVRALRYGVDNQQVPLCPPMPRFDGTDPAQPFMTDVEANAIVAYLRALPPVSRTIPSSMCARKKLHD